MPFGHSMPDKDAQQGQRQRQFESIYLRLSGERLVRILDEEEHMYWRYFIPVNVNGTQTGRSIVVGGNDNPLKRHMQALGEDHPLFSRVAKRMILNVLDRSPVIRIEDGRTVYADDAGAYRHPDKGTPLLMAGLVPNNRVLVMEFGPDLMRQMKSLNNRLRNRETFEPMSITSFDLRIITTGKGRDMTKQALPDGDQSPLNYELAEIASMRYDLKAITQPWPDWALDRLIAGEDYTALIKEMGWERVQPHWTL